ncbi:nucleoside 2-deoxyribosyltransferase [Methylocella sp.]|uniref:nucleoside 2-deoxyribosyltransferase n=1 Tax=Methylocella sp. TaxID=1978226 RepID=UPI003783B06C
MRSIPLASAKEIAARILTRFASERPRIYLAGKVRHRNDWRNRLTGGCVSVRDEFDPHEVVPLENFTMTGPFVSSWLEEHDPATHGVADGGGRSTERRRIFDADMARIGRSDFVFGYIDASDAHGTQVEIGHAHALGKPVFLTFDPALSENVVDDHWFAAQAAVVLPGPLEAAFATALNLWRSCRSRESIRSKPRRQ